MGCFVWQELEFKRTSFKVVEVTIYACVQGGNWSPL